jgi:5-methylcytosine-specific restriction endonuclease McrA
VTLVTTVEEALAEWPIPRLQRPYEPFRYAFDWSWEYDGRWSARRYRTSSRTITMFPGVGGALTSLGPLLRPFITRWWTDKAAQLNPRCRGRPLGDRVRGLPLRPRPHRARTDRGRPPRPQHGDCFDCHTRIASRRQIDHFIPWSHSGDDGLDNLVAACHTCNNRKRATLAGPEHLDALLRRNRAWTADLAAIANERRWPRDHPRSLRIARTAYLQSPDQRRLWIRNSAGDHYESLGENRRRLSSLLPLLLTDP